MGKIDRAHGGTRLGLLIAAGVGPGCSGGECCRADDPAPHDPDPPIAIPTTSEPIGTPTSAESPHPAELRRPRRSRVGRPRQSRPGRSTSREPTSRERYEQAARRELEQGLVAYNPPAQARVQEDFEVTVRVQRGTVTVSPSLRIAARHGPGHHREPSRRHLHAGGASGFGARRTAAQRQVPAHRRGDRVGLARDTADRWCADSPSHPGRGAERPAPQQPYLRAGDRGRRREAAAVVRAGVGVARCRRRGDRDRHRRDPGIRQAGTRVVGTPEGGQRRRAARTTVRRPTLRTSPRRRPPPTESRPPTTDAAANGNKPNP